MTSQRSADLWSSIEKPPYSTGSVYTRHSSYTSTTTPRMPFQPTHHQHHQNHQHHQHHQQHSHQKTSYTSNKSSVTSHPSQYRKRTEARKFVIDDFRQAFERKGMELDTSRKLGRGKYSKVYKAIDRINHRLIAVKAIDVMELTPDVKNKFLPREISCWRRLKSPFIVSLHAQYEAQNMIFLAMEYGSQGDLLRYVQENGGIGERKAGLFMSQLLRGLQYMHSKKIAHRDIKLENIILFDDCVKLSDFGFVRHMDENALSQTFCGSKSYSAPELLCGIKYDPFVSDIWSLGVVAFVMVTNRMPFDEKKPNNVIVDMQRARNYVFPTCMHLSTNCTSAIESMMTFDVQRRPDSTVCLSLPWISPNVVSSE